ncbi:hypothetical protein [Robertmurraya korlensis]|nr:hypothetical protein [Robertmurraya korlensis]
MSKLGAVEYYGEIIPITWNDYMNLMWLSDPNVVIVKVPERPNH